MSSSTFSIYILISLHFSTCLTTSDPNLYGNTSKPLDNDTPETTIFNHPSHPNYQPTNENGIHLTAEDFQNAFTIDDIHVNTPLDWVAPRHAANLFEGDISGVQSIQELRNAIVGRNYRWPNAVIPYIIGTPFTMEERSVIARALMEYHNKTCIRFVPRTIQPDYIVFKTTGSGCNSNVGRTGGAQTVSLDQGCVHVGLIIHELMHAAGFYHEQARTDRDDYVVINWANIQDGMQRNFDQLGPNEIELLGTRYDTGSVMHYDQFAFAKDRKIPTIYSKTGSNLGNTQGFSQNDIAKLNIMYQCRSEEVTTTARTITPTTQRTTTPIIQRTTTARPTTSEVTTVTNGTTTVTTTGMPPTETTTSKEPIGPECVDAMGGCVVWAGDGFCNHSVDLMTAFCRKTCGLCTDTDVRCVDNTPICVQFANMGQCNQEFLVTNCQKSCNACNKP
ncbi:zinc metalloproteinase nas-4-like [Daphnia carinata]|uniref:zinc metalloproteinase nas-4-like n=1 Tax=Daphnia carinata TaxID=120202 RepID=UPI00257AD691|nr:zinc metalloproteinase nas-4-like [Daphnia carinata]